MTSSPTAGVTAVITEQRAPGPDPATPGEVTDPATPGEVTGFTVTLDGVDVAAPVYAYEIASTEHGPQLTITLGVGAVQIGAANPQSPQRASGRSGRPVKVWEPALRDPREGIPNWQPEEVTTRG